MDKASRGHRWWTRIIARCLRWAIRVELRRLDEKQLLAVREWINEGIH
jgi:hypothetical protein